MRFLFLILPAFVLLQSCGENSEAPMRDESRTIEDSQEEAPKTEEAPETEKEPTEVDTIEVVAEDQDFIGLSMEDAKALAKERGQAHRVISIEGNFRPVTADYRPDRLNFEIENGKVTVVKRG